MAMKPVDTAIVVVVGPLIDDTDFKTLETGIAYDATGMSVDWIQEKTDGTTVKTDLTLTTGGNNDWAHIGNSYYSIEITVAQNNEEGVGYAAGVCTGVLPFESPHYDIVPIPVYNSLVAGSDNLQVDTVQISGDSTAADNLEAFTDGTGYAGTNNVIPTVTNVTNLHASAATAAELAKVPKSDSTVSWNATALGDINAQVDLALNTAIPGGATADSINERIATMDTTGVTVATNNDKTDYALTVADKDDIVDRVWDETLTGATHNDATSAGRRLRQLGDSLASTVSDVTPSTTNFTTALSGYADDFFNDQTIRFTSGNLSGQVRIVSDFVGVGGEITVDEALTEAPANGDAFDILPQHTHTKTQIAEAVWNNATRTLSSFGTLVADIWANLTRTITGGTITTYTGNTPQTGDNFARLGAPAGASVSADIAAVKAETALIVADTNELQTDWANGGRLDLLLDAADAPTAAEVRDAILDRVLNGNHDVVGSTGALIQSAGSAADPLLNEVPGSYASGTAGHALGRISSANITVTSPIATDGTVTIIKGDDYNNTDGRAIDWSNTDGDWPDLTSATIKFYMGPVEVTGSVVTPTGVGQKVRAEPTAVQTAKLKRGEYEYDVIATLATSSRIVTLASGRLTVDE